jgi:hypothetical protein
LIVIQKTPVLTKQQRDRSARSGQLAPQSGTGSSLLLHQLRAESDKAATRDKKEQYSQYKE